MVGFIYLASENHKVKQSCPQLDSNPQPLYAETDSLHADFLLFDQCRCFLTFKTLQYMYR